MTRDSLKTVIGLVLIVGIVGATFWYGNAQRQTQLRKSANTQATPTPTMSSAPTAGGTDGGNNTAPVKSPSSNVIQGGGASITPAPTQQPTAQNSVPTTGGSDTLPDTGAPISGIIGAVAMLGAAIWHRQSVGQARRARLR